VGVHDGGDNVAALVDTTAPYWPVSLVGVGGQATVYNITDGSSATITAAGDSIVGGLSGGTDDDWDDDDVYMIVPPPEWAFAETWCFELPTIARNGVGADCVDYSIRVCNDNDEGVFYAEQVECLENLVDNPSLETGAGNPYILDGWSNDGLDPGDTVQELAIVHSGVASLEFAAGAGTIEGVYDLPASTINKFYSAGVWSYGNGAVETRHLYSNGARLPAHSTFNTSISEGITVAYWGTRMYVGRRGASSLQMYLLGNATQCYAHSADCALCGVGCYQWEIAVQCYPEA